MGETLTLTSDDAPWVTAGEPVTMQAHQRLDYTGKSGHWLEGNVSGPVMKDLTFFISSKWARTAVTFPDPYLTSPFNTNTNLKLSYSASPNLKIRTGGFYNRRKGDFGGPATGGRLDLRDNFKNLFMVLPNASGDYMDTDRLLWASVTHSLSPKTFYELRLSQHSSSRDTLNNQTWNADQSLVTSGNPIRDKAGYYTVYRNVVNWDMFSYNRLILKADVSSQMNKQNFVKGGIEVIRFNNWYKGYWSDGPSHRYVRWYTKEYNDVDYFSGQETKGASPIQMGAYIQDKIEFEGMIVNAGIRADILLPREYVTDVDGFYGAKSPMWMSMTHNKAVPTIVPDAVKTVSPRLGISHPITAKALIRFFYGKFFQNPQFYMLYNNEWASQSAKDMDLNGNGTIDAAERWNAFNGNDARHHSPHMPPEETTSFELGLDWNFVSEYVIGLTSYYKSAGDQHRGSGQLQWIDPVAPAYVAGQGSYSHGSFVDTRGFELSLRKQFSKMFSFNLAYNMQWAQSGHQGVDRRDVWPDSLFVANGHYWTQYDVDPATGKEIPVDLRTMAIRDGRDDPDYYIKDYGNKASTAVRTQQTALDKRSSWSWIPWYSHNAAQGVELHSGEWDQTFYDGGDTEFWERVNGEPDYPGTGEGNLMVGHNSQSGEVTPIGRDRRAFGSMTLLFATPTDFGPWEGKALGSLRGNLVYRMFSGSRFAYVSVGSSITSYRMGPMHTRMDLNVEKQFGSASGLNLTLAVEIYNLFNQQDNRQGGTSGMGVDINLERWQKWGITGLDPTTGDYQTYGEIWDIGNYYDTPREMNFSLRIKF